MARRCKVPHSVRVRMKALPTAEEINSKAGSDTLKAICRDLRDRAEAAEADADMYRSRVDSLYRNAQLLFEERKRHQTTIRMLAHLLDQRSVDALSEEAADEIDPSDDIPF